MNDLNENQIRLVDIANELADTYAQLKVEISESMKYTLTDKINELLEEKSEIQQREDEVWTPEDEEKAQQDRDTMKDLEDAQI